MILPVLLEAAVLAQVDLRLPPLLPGSEIVFTESRARLRYFALWDVELTLEVETTSPAEIRITATGEDGAIADPEESAPGEPASLVLDLSAREAVELEIRVGPCEPGTTTTVRAHESPGFEEWLPPVGTALAITAEQRAADGRAEALYNQSVDAMARDPGEARRLVREVAGILRDADPELRCAELQGGRLSVARHARNLGDGRLSEEMFASVIAHLERVRSRADPEIQHHRVDRSHVLRQVGEFQAAFEETLVALAVYERTRPEDDVFRQWARMNAAISRGELAAWEDVSEVLADVADRFSRLASSPAAAANPGSDSYRKWIVSLPIAARTNLARSLDAAGRIVEVRAIYEGLLRDLRANPEAEVQQVIRTLQNLGAARFMCGDRVGARLLFEEGFEIARARFPEDHQFVVALRNSLLQCGSGEDAEQELEIATHALLAIGGESDGDRRFRAEALELRADRLADVGRHEEALADLDRALELRLSIRGDPDSAAALNRARRGRLVAAAGDPRAGLDQIQAVLDRIEPALGPDSSDRLAVLGWAGRMAFELKDPSLGAIVREVADAVEARQRTPPFSSPHALAAWIAKDEPAVALLATVAAAEPDGSELRERVFERIETMRALASIGAAPYAAAREDPELRDRIARASEARERLTSVVSPGLFGAGSVSVASGDLSAAQSRREQCDQAVRARLEELGEPIPEVTVKELQDALPAGAVVVSFRSFHPLLTQAEQEADPGHDLRGPDDPTRPHGRFDAHHRLLAHVVRSGRPLARVELGPAATIEAAVARWGESVRPSGAGLRAPDVVLPQSAGSSSGRVDPDSELRRLVLDPILAQVSGAATLYLCLDAPLQSVPWDALTLADGGLLGDRCEVVLLHSLAVGAQAPAPDADADPDRRVLLVGGVDYGAPDGDLAGVEPQSAGTGAGRGPTFSPLAATRRECESIATILATSPEVVATFLDGAVVTKARLREAATGARLLHVATHGYFAGEEALSFSDLGRDLGEFAAAPTSELVMGLAPMTLCGLALSGANAGMDELGRMPGVLTAEELCTFDLSGCELAVLSACSTSAGVARAGQGVASLQAALHAAGARHAVTSLWSVDDASTSRWMEAFYRAYWQEKLPCAQAVWKAKRELRDAGAPLADWAGWVHSTTLRASGR